MKYRLCTLPDDANHIFYNIRVITESQPSMPDDVVAKLDCNNEKAVPYGTDMACNTITDWKVSFGTTMVSGRCPRCEQDRLYPGMYCIRISMVRVPPA